MKEYNLNFKKHLEALSVDFNYIATSCPHDFFRILNDSDVGVIYEKEEVF